MVRPPPNHVLIVGDNWQVLQNLLITCYKSIDIIYIDPPYNTGGSDLTYKDKFSKNAWLNMMKQRMEIAYQLLTDDGVIFVSLDDNMQAYFKVMMDSIFGEENFVSNLIWDKKNSQNDADFVEQNHEYILMYAKNKLNLKLNKELIINDAENRKCFSLLLGNTAGGLLNNRYKMGQTVYWLPKTDEKIVKVDYDLEKAKTSNDPNIYQNCKELIDLGYIPIRPKIFNGKLGRWKWSPEKMQNEISRLVVSKAKTGEYTLLYKDNRDIKEKGIKSIISNFSSSLGTTLIHDFNLEFSNPKPVALIKSLINMCPKKDHQVILDFFAGSGTTGQAVLELNKEDNGNRQFILCQIDASKDTNQDEEYKEAPNDGSDNQITLDDLEKSDAKTSIKMNIAYDVCYERLYRIAKGQGTNGETFDWLKKKNEHNQQNEAFFNALDVYYINELDVSLKNNPHAEYLSKINFDIYNKIYHDTHLRDKAHGELNLNIDNAPAILYPLLDHIEQ